MNFRNKLLSFVGDTVQVVTGFQVATGVLTDVTNSTLTIHTVSAPGYGGGQDVIYQLDRITYVRVV